MNMNMGKLQEMMRDREVRCAVVLGGQRVGRDWATEQQQHVTMWTFPEAQR